MNIDDFPGSEEDVVDILAKAGYLKVENDKVEVSLDSSDTLNIQPKKNIFGLKITVEEDNSITPTLTFDTKKLRGEKYIDYKKWAYEKCNGDTDKIREVLGHIDSVIQFMNIGSYNQQKLRQFFDNNHRLDVHHKEDFWAVFPELGWLREHIN